MSRRLNWADYRASEFANLDPMKTIAILPTCAIEQHGPHLPVGTDTLIAEGMLARLREKCPDDLDIRILPAQAVGKSTEHLWAAGTLTLDAPTALAAWTQIGLSVARAGVKKIVVVNSHGGNLDLVSILTRELRVQAGMLAVKCQWMGFGAPEGVFSERQEKFGIHGGDDETSVMLAFNPDLVDMTKAENFVSSAENSLISPTGPVSYGWISSDLHPSGTVGDAAESSAEKGHAIVDHQIDAMINLLRLVEASPLPSAPTGWR